MLQGTTQSLHTDCGTRPRRFPEGPRAMSTALGSESKLQCCSKLEPLLSTLFLNQHSKILIAPPPHWIVSKPMVQCRTKFGRTPTKFHRYVSCQSLASAGPILAEFGLCRAKHSSKSVESGPVLVDSGPCLTECGRVRVNVFDSGLKLVDSGAQMTMFVFVGAKLVDPGRTFVEIGGIRAHLHSETLGGPRSGTLLE